VVRTATGCGRRRGTAGAHTGQASAAQVSKDLPAVTDRGTDELVMDMIATISCDYTGADALLRARQRAVASGPVLGPTVTDPAVRRMFSRGRSGREQAPDKHRIKTMPMPVPRQRPFRLFSPPGIPTETVHGGPGRQEDTRRPR
jgi:hypothetical protein